jgi:hypothetical protein
MSFLAKQAVEAPAGARRRNWLKWLTLELTFVSYRCPKPLNQEVSGARAEGPPNNWSSGEASGPAKKLAKGPDGRTAPRWTGDAPGQGALINAKNVPTRQISRFGLADGPAVPDRPRRVKSGRVGGKRPEGQVGGQLGGTSAVSAFWGLTFPSFEQGAQIGSGPRTASFRVIISTKRYGSQGNGLWSFGPALAGLRTGPARRPSRAGWPGREKSRRQRGAVNKCFLS